MNALYILAGMLVFLVVFVRKARRLYYELLIKED